MKHRLSIVVCLSLISSLSAPDAPRAPRPATDTGSESSTGPVGEAFSAVPANGVTLPNDVNIVHDLQVGNELILTGAHLLLPVAAVAPITALTEGSVADIAGILSMYDATRSSWLSVDRPQVWFTRPGGTIDSYLNVTENIPSKTTGYRMLRDATVTGLTAASGNNVWYVASSGGDFTDLASALASGSVGDGDIISMACETFSTTTEITVSKSVTIQGCSSGTVLQMPSTGTSYNLLSVTANSVTIQNLTLIQQKPHDVADASTVISVANGVTGFHADKLNITTTDWGILMRSAQGIIENSNFYYQGVAGVKHRFLGFYGNTGTTLVRNNTFYPSSDTPVAKTIFCYLTDTSDYAGELIFQNNTQAGTGNLLQFFLQDSFPGIAGGFTLYFAGNSYNDLSGGIIFYGGSDFMDLFASITVVNNTVSNGGGKGLVGFDGYLS
ncbi:MAG: hypothetical protein M1549_02665, partial [Candidatus Dependentiae bacterium]|nr:hypothetical protein [Candidatus Dependentiae bacterium]